MARTNQDQGFEAQQQLQKSIRVWSRTMIGSAVAIVVSLLAGLGGTVIGMLRSFETMGIAGGSDPSELAEDISFALVTTAAGVFLSILFGIVFLVSVFIYLSLRKKAGR